MGLFVLLIFVMIGVPITQARKSLFLCPVSTFILFAKTKVKEHKIAEYFELLDKKDFTEKAFLIIIHSLISKN